MDLLLHCLMVNAPFTEMRVARRACTTCSLSTMAPSAKFLYLIATNKQYAFMKRHLKSEVLIFPKTNFVKPNGIFSYALNIREYLND